MKLFSFFMLFFIGIMLMTPVYLSCRLGKELPEADICIFVLISKDSTAREDKTEYVYKWYCRGDHVTYAVYTFANYVVSPGDLIRGLIRK